MASIELVSQTDTYAYTDNGEEGIVMVTYHEASGTYEVGAYNDDGDRIECPKAVRELLRREYPGL